MNGTFIPLWPGHGTMQIAMKCGKCDGNLAELRLLVTGAVTA